MIKGWEWYCEYQWDDEHKDETCACPFRGELDVGEKLTKHIDIVWGNENNEHKGAIVEYASWDDTEAYRCNCDSKDKCPLYVKYDKAQEKQREEEQHRMEIYTKARDLEYKHGFANYTLHDHTGKEYSELTEEDLQSYDEKAQRIADERFIEMESKADIYDEAEYVAFWKANFAKDTFWQLDEILRRRHAKQV